MNEDLKIAHVAEDGRVHGLQEHLRGTAILAGEFSAEFGCASWGYLVGLWHDLGKYAPEFQRYIRMVNTPDAHVNQKGGDHSTAGALHALKQFGPMGQVCTYPIAGHHAGLPDWQEGGAASLAYRLQKSELLERALGGEIPIDILQQAQPTERPKGTATELSRAFWLRMLFSCVVDADFLDTEAFFDPDKTRERGGHSSISMLLSKFTEFMAKMQSQAADTAVNRIRSEVLKQCIAKAGHNSGFFTLTVPTGGGKTLSSMAFALHHAMQKQKRRIIYVIPYTSIIEQAADQFRRIFADDVIEHHSNLDVEDEARENGRSRLACENWDAPVIVTTSVQFFESLFASRTSRSRKLHNLVNSVIVLDESQLLPPDFLLPILEVLNELQKNYGTTIVFSTATQPALGPHKTLDFDFKGLSGMTEIMDSPAELFVRLKRTRVSVFGNLGEAQSWESIAERLQQHESVLCIVNRRDDARVLWSLMPAGTYHLSALMCGAHRSKQIKEIKSRMQEGLPTRVISTQLVEAGVDLDFPVVYRAVAGLDSVAQAAGRCNREGLKQVGEVFVFLPPSQVPAGHLRQAADIGTRLLEARGDEALSPEGFEAFFREFYWIRGDRLDREGILGLLENDAHLRFSFREAARRFKLIDDRIQVPVIVWYENDELLRLLELQGPERWFLRRLQRSVVNLPRYLHGELLASGAIREIHSGLYLQGHKALYDRDVGFCVDRSLVYDPDDLIC